jgi:hypothetical protein
VVFHGGQPADDVWIVQQGRVELSVGSRRRRTVVHVLRPGDVDGDIPLLLDMPLPYRARVLDDATLLSLTPTDFEHLLATGLPIARRWLPSVAQRLAASQMRLLSLFGHTLTEQVTRLLLDEAIDGQVPLPQRTLAAMLGAQTPGAEQDPQRARTRRTHWRALRHHRHPRPGGFDQTRRMILTCHDGVRHRQWLRTRPVTNVVLARQHPFRQAASAVHLRQFMSSPCTRSSRSPGETRFYFASADRSLGRRAVATSRPMSGSSL